MTACCLLCRRGLQNATTGSCGLCAVGSYLDALANACRACPAGPFFYCTLSYAPSHITNRLNVAWRLHRVNVLRMR